MRAREIEATRQSKLQRLQGLVADRNAYLRTHPRAKVQTALRMAQEKAKRLKIHTWIEIKAKERELSIEIDKDEKNNEARLDGCYAIKTDLSDRLVSTQTIHARYKGLAEVEFAFRTMKTTFLEMPGIFVPKASPFKVCQHTE
jgi:hypothetical protein